MLLPSSSPDDCSGAFTDLYQPNDTCANIIRRMIMGDITALVEFNTVSDDCQTRTENYFASCSGIYGDQSLTEVCMFLLLQCSYSMSLDQIRPFRRNSFAVYQNLGKLSVAISKGTVKPFKFCYNSTCCESTFDKFC